MEKAIIGGTGLYRVAEKVETRTISTDYGQADVEIVTLNGQEIVFLARHGRGHSVPPHLINYRANIKALELLGVRYVLATAAVGSCHQKYNVGEVVVIKDFLDFTKSRPITFFEGGEHGVVHTDMSDPYCSNLRRKFYAAAQHTSLDIKGDAVYVCTEGPRFESAAEIKMYKSMGGDVVGMTSIPELVLAKELGMCYMTAGIITNLCTGVSNSEVSLHDIQGAMEQNKEKIVNTFLDMFEDNLNQQNCNCRTSTMKL